MAFRSLVLVSLLLAGCATAPAGSVQTAGQPRVLVAVNAALSDRVLVMESETPVLK